MEKVKVEIKLYEYDELKGEAKERAFNEHEEFLNNCLIEVENDERVMDKTYLEHTKKDIEDSLRVNEYLFFKDGEMADICIFTGKHEKVGKTEFYFNGEVYNLN